MRDAENIREVERLGIDMMGFICWERSPRYVREVPAYLPNCPRVGVFVNPTLDEIQKRMEAFEFSYIQLHGSESPEFCREVREKTGCKIIKAKSIQKENPLPLREGWGGSVDLLLFDTTFFSSTQSARLWAGAASSSIGTSSPPTKETCPSCFREASDLRMPSDSGSFTTTNASASTSIRASKSSRASRI